jgi:hypothetical protein
MIIGGEVCVTHRDTGVMYPLLANAPMESGRPRLDLVVYLILHNDRHSADTKTDQALIGESSQMASSSECAQIPNVRLLGSPTLCPSVTNDYHDQARQSSADLQMYFDSVTESGVGGLVLTNRSTELVHLEYTRN